MPSAFNLNSLSSLYTAEAIAIFKAMEKATTEEWTLVNICSDLLSVLTKLEGYHLFFLCWNKSQFCNDESPIEIN